MLSKGRQPDAIPPPSRLESAVRNLTASGRHRELILFVERWSSYDDPPPMARLAQARALLALAQVDRAWIRVQELAHDPKAPADTLALAARIQLARGWPKRARDYLTRALTDAPDDTAIQTLWDRAAEPPTEPSPATEEQLRQVESPTVAEALIDNASSLAQRGRTVLARGILERVVQAHPEHPRAGDLLWALDLDPSSETRSLMELTDAFAPVQLMLGDFVDENTESITQETLRAELDVPDDSGSHQFPSLFRSGDRPADPEPIEATDEVTQSLSHELAPLQPIGADTLPSADGFDSDADTRIVRVRNRDGLPEGLHHAFDTPAAGGFDLAAYRREMGVDTHPGFEPDLEDEDEDLVVLTGRETATPAPARAEEDPTQTQIGREVAHLMGGPKPRTPVPAAAPIDPIASTPAPARRQDERPTPEAPASAADPTPDPTSLESPPRRPLWPWLIALAVAALAAFGTAGLLIITLFVRSV